MNLWPARSWLLVDLSPATPPNVPASLVRAAAAIPAKAPDLHLLQEAEAAAHAAVDTLAKRGEEVIVRALDAHAAGNGTGTAVVAALAANAKATRRRFGLTRRPPRRRPLRRPRRRRKRCAPW